MSRAATNGSARPGHDGTMVCRQDSTWGGGGGAMEVWVGVLCPGRSGRAVRPDRASDWVSMPRPPSGPSPPPPTGTGRSVPRLAGPCSGEVGRSAGHRAAPPGLRGGTVPKGGSLAQRMPSLPPIPPSGRSAMDCLTLASSRGGASLKEPCACVGWTTHKRAVLQRGRGGGMGGFRPMPMTMWASPIDASRALQRCMAPVWGAVGRRVTARGRRCIAPRAVDWPLGPCRRGIPASLCRAADCCAPFLGRDE